MKKRPEAGSHFEENCFIPLPLKGPLYRLQDWGSVGTLRTEQIKKLWQGYSSFKPFGKETKSSLALERWALGRDGHREPRGAGALGGVGDCCVSWQGPHGVGRRVLGIGEEGKFWKVGSGVREGAVWVRTRGAWDPTLRLHYKGVG